MQLIKIVCSVLVRYLFGICSVLVRYLFGTCSVFVRYLFGYINRTNTGYIPVVFQINQVKTIAALRVLIPL